MSKKIGLIGGLALRAGVFYYEQLLERFTVDGRSLELLLSHADVKKVLAAVASNDVAALANYLGALANELHDGGADLVAITAIAPHLAIREVSEIARVPLMNVLDAAASGLQSAGISRIAIFGNRTVMQSNIFGILPEDRVVKPDADQLEEIHDTYTAIALNGKKGSPKEVRFLSETAEALMKKGAQAIVLAGTDLSSFYAEQRPDYPHLDLAQLHIQQIVRFATT